MKECTFLAQAKGINDEALRVGYVRVNMHLPINNQ